ncbi:MAG: hypothetical protein GVY20_14045 [Bacteroidetes bacterium]|jgi:hypothetical protein|nr:hypothetical protein [Bacteroidota bacterium]
MLREILQKPKGRIILVIAMTAVLVAAWFPVLNNDFLTNWDDQWMVTGNPHLQLDTPEAVQAMFTESYGGQYSPVNTLAYLSIVKTGGMQPFGFQLLFLLLHLGNFLLVGLILQNILLMIPGVKLNNHHRYTIAWAAAVLFAVHPMQVEAVAWISASKVVLYSFFYLLGLWLYLLYRQTKKRGYFWAVLACFLASLLSKEQAVVFVLTIILVDWAIREDSDSVRFLIPKKQWIEKIPFFIAGILFGLITISISVRSGAGGEAYTFGQRILFGNYSFWEYLVKLTAPYGLSHFYFFPVDPGESVPLRFWFYPMATIGFVWILSEFREHLNRVHVFGGLFFLINIITVLHIIPIPRESIMADRYIYLSAAGFFLIVVYVLVRWFVALKGRAKKFTLVTIGSLYLIALAGYTNERVKVWNNMETLQQDLEHVTLRHLGKNPSEAMEDLLIVNVPVCR